MPSAPWNPCSDFGFGSTPNFLNRCMNSKSGCGQDQESHNFSNATKRKRSRCCAIFSRLITISMSILTLCFLIMIWIYLTRTPTFSNSNPGWPSGPEMESANSQSNSWLPHFFQTWDIFEDSKQSLNISTKVEGTYAVI